MEKIENIYLERKEDGFNVVILYNGEQVVIASYTGKEKALYPEPAVQEDSVVIALKWVRENGVPCPEGLPSRNVGKGYRHPLCDCGAGPATINGRFCIVCWQAYAKREN